MQISLPENGSQQCIVCAMPLCPHLSMTSFWCGPPHSQLCKTRTWTSWSAGSHPGRGADSAEWWQAWPWQISDTHWYRPASRPAGGRTRLEEWEEVGSEDPIKHCDLMTDCFNRLIGSRNMNGKLKTLLKGNQKLNVYRNTSVKKQHSSWDD